MKKSPHEPQPNISQLAQYHAAKKQLEEYVQLHQIDNAQELIKTSPWIDRNDTQIHYLVVQMLRSMTSLREYQGDKLKENWMQFATDTGIKLNTADPHIQETLATLLLDKLQNGNLVHAQFLIEQGIALTITDSTALIKNALQSNNIVYAQHLIELGLKIDPKELELMLIYDLATQNQQRAKFLIEKCHIQITEQNPEIIKAFENFLRNAQYQAMFSLVKLYPKLFQEGNNAKFLYQLLTNYNAAAKNSKPQLHELIITWIRMFPKETIYMLRDNENQTLLHAAAKLSDGNAIVALLISTCPELAKTESNLKITALMLAVSKEEHSPQDNTVELLIPYSDLNARNTLGLSALHFAVFNLQTHTLAEQFIRFIVKSFDISKLEERYTELSTVQASDKLGAEQRKILINTFNEKMLVIINGIISSPNQSHADVEKYKQFKTIVEKQITQIKDVPIPDSKSR